MILAAGEALIDLVMASDMSPPQFSAHVGGAPLNAAVALGRLDVPVRFACPISNDKFGDMIREKLTASNVGLAAPNAVSQPSPLAMVTLNEKGVPAYQFYREGTADRQIDDAFMGQCLATPFQALHIGGTCLSNAVDFAKWMALVDAAKTQGAVISIDPNIRPTLIDDAEDFAARMQVAFTKADIIKASDEDCETLFGHADMAQLVDGPFAAAHLVVMTKGAEGATAHLASGELVQVPITPIDDVRDTVGAGDCFQAGLLSHLWNSGALASQTDFHAVALATVEMAVRVGHAAAAINCARNGCDPAWQSEMPLL